ncbi:serine hydrolase domain-containing protein [Mesorhizobium shangrilense]|uniref:Serine hydrolase domain-containing protein n=1 Tax=Mesorhizobium shangrilense TaxID=460060 RepID=A0ABV2DEL8_9HYPH
MIFSTELDEYLSSEIEPCKVPGLGVAVVRSGEIIHLAGYGLANVENDTPAGPYTLFHSGSTGKMFTAASVLLLLQDGRIGLDEPLKTYIPEGPPSWAGITIRHLLSMMSGFGNFEITFAPTDIQDGAVPINLWQDHGDQQLIELASRAQLLFEPGQGYQYSNTGYILAAIIVARISGKPYYELLRERLFEPVGMTTAREASWFDIVPNRAAGYCMRDGRLTNRYWAAPTLQCTGDGGLYFSPRDIAHWLMELDNPRVLRRDLVELMSEPASMQDGRTSFNGYGLGWQNSEIRGHRKIRHGGTWDGFRAEIARFPARNLSVCVLANMDEAQTARIAQNVAGIVDPDLAPYEPIVDVDPGMTRRDGHLWQAIVAQRVSRDSFTEQAWHLWDQGRLQQVVAASEANPTAMPWEPVHHDSDGTGCLRRYRLLTGGYHIHWMIKRVADGRVSDMRFHME